jgi:hypothetical protein
MAGHSQAASLPPKRDSSRATALTIGMLLDSLDPATA